MRNIAFFGSTGPSSRSNLATLPATSPTSAWNSSRSTSYAGLFHAIQGRLLFCSSPCRNSISALICMGVAVPPNRASVASACSAADVAHLDLRQRARVFRADFRIAIGAPRPDGGKMVADLVVGRATAHQRAEVDPFGGEQACVELAVGGEPRPRAVAAKRLCHRRDDADLAATVAVAPARRDFAGVVGVDR